MKVGNDLRRNFKHRFRDHFENWVARGACDQLVKFQIKRIGKLSSFDGARHFFYYLFHFIEVFLFSALRRQASGFRFENQTRFDDVVHRDFSQLQQRLKGTADHAMIRDGDKDPTVDTLLDVNHASLLQTAESLAHRRATGGKLFSQRALVRQAIANLKLATHDGVPDLAQDLV